MDSGFSVTCFKAKIAEAEKQHVPTTLVIGGRDMEVGAVSVRLHHGDLQGAKPKGEVSADILMSSQRVAGVMTLVDKLSAPQQAANLR